VVNCGQPFRNRGRLPENGGNSFYKRVCGEGIARAMSAIAFGQPPVMNSFMTVEENLGEKCKRVRGFYFFTQSTPHPSLSRPVHSRVGG